jgi:hypothetical protein
MYIMYFPQTWLDLNQWYFKQWFLITWILLKIPNIGKSSSLQ